MLQYPIHGSYGKVSLVETVPDLNQVQPEPKPGGLLSRLGFGGSAKKIVNAYLQIPEHVIFQKVVGYDVLNALPEGRNRDEREDLARVIYLISQHYSRATERSGKKSPYYLGLILSDFVEVVPIEIAGKILYAASNRETSEDIAEGRERIFGGVPIPAIRGSGPSTLELAVEAIVLLPDQKRYEVFVELSRLDPSQEGNAHNLFRLITMNMSQRDSPYSGTMLIYKNLEGEQASTKANEVMGDLPKLGELVRQSFGSR